MVSEANVLERKQLKVLKWALQVTMKETLFEHWEQATQLFLFLKQTGEQKNTIVMVVNVILERERYLLKRIGNIILILQKNYAVSQH